MKSLNRLVTKSSRLKNLKSKNFAANLILELWNPIDKINVTCY